MFLQVRTVPAHLDFAAAKKEWDAPEIGAGDSRELEWKDGEVVLWADEAGEEEAAVAWRQAPLPSP